MDTNIEFAYRIEKSQEGLYLRIPVDIPDNISSLEFTYNYNSDTKTEIISDDGSAAYKALKTINAVDFGLEGPDGRLRGTCGNERRSFFISETTATPGYMTGPIDPGSWNIILGAYKICDSGCEVTLKVKLNPKQARWYKGDLHLHSINSDGVYEPEQLAQQAAVQKLDYIAITDHNSRAHNTMPPKVHGVTIIPGMELTYFKGHANLLGTARPVDTFVANSSDEVSCRLKEASESGALISINHPFCRSCGWHFSYDQTFDAVEVWNGPMKQQELEAIDWWHNELCKGRRLTAIGGSDMHKHEVFRTIGTPTTWVLADSDGPSDIIAAIRAGRCAISWQPKGPLTELEIGNAKLGGSVNYHDGLEGKIKVSYIEKGDIIKLINSGGCVFELKSKCSGMLEYSFKAEKCSFYRAEAWREVLPGLRMPVALCNPVFIT